MATNAMDWDMEVDDFDNKVIPFAESSPHEKLQIPTVYYEDLNDDQSSTLSKVHICGVDILTTNDIKAYVREHFGELKRVEWIDDTSANLLFSSAAEANNALNSLAAGDISTQLDSTPESLYPAKLFSEKPEVTLLVRRALVSDKKEAGAAARSRFYLLNPEYDPEERARRRETKEKHRQRERRNNQKSYHDRNNRIDDNEIEKFNDDFYDDNASTSRSKRRERTYSRSTSPNRSITDRDSGRNGRELFPDRIGEFVRRGRHDNVSRNRDRSASPMRGRNYDTLQDVDNQRLRNNSDSDRDRFIKDQQRLNNRSKELFPIKYLLKDESTSHLDQLDASSRLRDEVGSSRYQGFAIKGAASMEPTKELFPSRLSGNSGKELFNEKLQNRGQHRSRAENHW